MSFQDTQKSKTHTNVAPRRGPARRHTDIGNIYGFRERLASTRVDEPAAAWMPFNFSDTIS